jgi:hypothetical protein
MVVAQLVTSYLARFESDHFLWPFCIDSPQSVHYILCPLCRRLISQAPSSSLGQRMQQQK